MTKDPKKKGQPRKKDLSLDSLKLMANTLEKLAKNFRDHETILEKSGGKTIEVTQKITSLNALDQLVTFDGIVRDKVHQASFTTVREQVLELDELNELDKTTSKSRKTTSKSR